MNNHESASPIIYKFFTPGVIVLSILALNGLFFIGERLLFGIGAVTNLNNYYPGDCGLVSTLPPEWRLPPEGLPPPRWGM